PLVVRLHRIALGTSQTSHRRGSRWRTAVKGRQFTSPKWGRMVPRRPSMPVGSANDGQCRSYRAPEAELVSFAGPGEQLHERIQELKRGWGKATRGERRTHGVGRFDADGVLARVDRCLGR